MGKWKNPFNRRDLPKRLGIEIQQEANGVTYTHALGAHSQFKIHASKVVQLKQGNALLHDVKIELYGEDGSRVDRIEGDEFEYDQKAGTAKAAGPVEITLMRPGVAPAIAPKAAAGQCGERQAERRSCGLGRRSCRARRDPREDQRAHLRPEQRSGHDQPACGFFHGAGNGQFDGRHLRLAAGVAGAGPGCGVDDAARRARRFRFTPSTRSSSATSQVCRLHAATAEYQGGRSRRPATRRFSFARMDRRCGWMR